MALSLPAPIAAYFASETAPETTPLSGLFTPDAVVHDEGGRHAGLAAIGAWRSAGRAKYRHSTEALAAERRDGIVVVSGKVSGDFPNSPVTLEFRFTLDGERIAGLDIH